MCRREPATDHVGMDGVERPQVGRAAHGERPSVLVVFASPAVGLALAGRLIDFPVIELVHSGAVSSVARDRQPDVVVLDPYLSGAERRRLATAFRGKNGSGVAIIEICAPPDGPHVNLVGEADGAVADAVLAALDLPRAETMDGATV